MICSPVAGNIGRGQYYMSRVNKSSCYPHKRAKKNCFIMPINIFVSSVKKKMNTDQRCVLISLAVKLLRVQILLSLSIINKLIKSWVTEMSKLKQYEVCK